MAPHEHAAAAEALRAVVGYLDWNPAEGDFSRTLSGPAGAMLLRHMIEALRFAASKDEIARQDPEGFIRRYLAALIEHHTLAALDAELAASGDGG